jgi:hypothetical protein
MSDPDPFPRGDFRTGSGKVGRSKRIRIRTRNTGSARVKWITKIRYLTVWQIEKLNESTIAEYRVYWQCPVYNLAPNPADVRGGGVGWEA